MNAETNV